MPLQLNKVHEYKRINESGQAVLVRLNPLIRLSKGSPGDPDYMNIFIQGGEFYTEDGKTLPKEAWPKWLSEELAKLTPQARKEVGLSEPPVRK